MKVEAVVKKKKGMFKSCSTVFGKQKLVILKVSIMIIQHIFNLKVNRSGFYSGYNSDTKYESKHLYDGFEY